jgi:hypothetical protein
MKSIRASSGTDSYSYPEYPADGSGYILDPVYIWGNTDGANNSVDNSYIFGPDFSSDGCGHGLTSAQFLQLNRDFYIGVPKPNYKPYTYPHPLRSNVAPGIEAAPAPPQNRRIAN